MNSGEEKLVELLSTKEGKEKLGNSFKDMIDKNIARRKIMRPNMISNMAVEDRDSSTEH